MHSKRREILCLLAAVSLPLLSHPLSWLPHRWAQSRFDVAVPLAALFLVSWLVAFARQTLRATRSEYAARLLWPSVAVAASLLVSVRTSSHPHFSVQLLPAMLGNLAIFLLAAKIPQQSLPRLCLWWLGAAIVVALNGLVRRGSEPEFLSTIGNRNFLGAYLTAAIPIGIALWNRRAFLGCLVHVCGQYFCESRGAWLALAVV